MSNIITIMCHLFLGIGPSSLKSTQYKTMASTSLPSQELHQPDAIKDVLEKDRQTRLKEAETLRTSYGTKFNWAKQSRDLLHKMISIVHGMAFQICCMYTVTCKNCFKRKVGMKYCV